MTEQEIRDYAETIYPPQKGKHWIRTLRNAKVEAFVRGVLWNQRNGLKFDKTERYPDCHSCGEKLDPESITGYCENCM